MKIICDQYPAVRVVAADISIEIVGDEACGWHAIVLLIDMRGDTHEEWTVEFFDSTGCPPEEELSCIMEELAVKLREFRKKIKNKMGKL